MAKNHSAFASGMRGNTETIKKYHPNQSPEVQEDKPEGKQSGAVVDGVEETPSVFSSGMRGNEQPKNPLESEVESTNEDEAPKGLPAGSEIIGSTKSHHIVRVPIGKGKTPAVPA